MTAVVLLAAFFALLTAVDFVRSPPAPPAWSPPPLTPRPGLDQLGAAPCVLARRRR
ncbi:hypothetical protein ACFQX8_23645 [Klenkia terrae]|uniref:hypothetical protein n=1 Tax=Klenkia terrae TaxID=1052259 RepID=UPI00361A8744